MVLAMSVTVFAEDTYSIKINLPEGDKGTHTFTAYQIFTGDLKQGDTNNSITFTDGNTGKANADKELSNVQWGTAFTTDTTKEAFVQALVEDTTLGGLPEVAALRTGDAGNYVYSKDATKVAAALGKITTKEQAEALAKVVNANISDSTTKAKEVTGVNADNDPALLADLATGYYFVKDTVTSDTTDENIPTATSKYVLQVLSDVEITSKTNVPSSNKKVDDKDDSTDAEDTTDWQDSADYDEGDVVPYKLTAFIPVAGFNNYTQYDLAFFDDISKGLTYNGDAKVTIYQISKEIPTNGVVTTADAITDTVIDPATITAENGGTSSYEGGHKYKFDLGDIKAANPTYPMGTIVNNAKYIVVEIAYTATVNSDAVINEAGNPNKSHIEFSNNPNDTTGKGNTPDDTVIVFTYKAVVNKVKQNGDPLTGADFRLDKLYKNYTVKEADYENYVFFNDTEAGRKLLLDAPASGQVYVRTTNGSIITVASGDAAKNGNVAITTTPVTSTNKDFEDVYVRINLTKGGEGDKAGTVFTSDKIDAGSYLITETVTPAGYNSVEPKELVITANHQVLADDPHLTSLNASNGWTLTSITEEGVVTATDGTATTDIINQSGSVLPSTGGIGTTIFYVLGAILVIGAGVLLITRRRMSAN